MAIISGTLFNDSLRGTDLTADLLFGGDGNDVLSGEQRTVKLLSTVNGLTSAGGLNAAVSDNGGFVAFKSSLVGTGDTNVFQDVYVADVATGQLTLVSRSAEGVVGNDNSSGPVLSADGRFVAFTSAATNLVGAADTNGLSDVFVKDLLTGAIERVSTATGGTQATGGGSGVLDFDNKGISISADGRFVAFQSGATNLVTGDDNAFTDIFLKDRVSGETVRLSVSSDGAQANGSSTRPMVCADGQRVVFVSAATNLVAGDSNATSDIFLRDIASEETLRVSTASDGGQANGNSIQPAISRDGRYVAFMSNASNLVPGDSNGSLDLFVKNLESGEIVRANTSAAGAQSSGLTDNNGVPSISGDGRFVVFLSFAANLVPGDTNGMVDVFVKDLQTGSIARVSIAPDGTQGNGGAFAPSISADGRIITWDTTASTVNPSGSGAENIVAATNPLFSMDALAGGPGNDTYVLRSYDLVMEQPGEGSDTVHTDLARYTLPSNVENLQISGGVGSMGQGNELANVLSGGPGVDRLEGLAGNDVLNGERGVLRASAASGGAQANGLSFGPDLSADGRYVAFSSTASNLAGRNVNLSASDAFVKDVATGRTVLASPASGTTQTANGASDSVSIRADGNVIAFASPATNLVAGDTNAVHDIFVRNIVTNVTTRASLASDGTTQGNGASLQPAISSSGNAVAFISSATNLVAGDTNGVLDVFLKPLGNGVLTRVSTSSGGVQANAASFNPSVSGDGLVVAFDSAATNLVVADANGFTDVFAKVVNTDTTSLISVSTAGVQGNGDSFAPVLTPNGQWVLFQSRASNLVAGDSNGTDDIFLRDRIAGTTIRVSTATDGGQANSGAASGDISDDGRFVVFASPSTNLVAGDTSSLIDIFVKDLLTGRIERVSIAADGARGNSHSLNPAISGDGRVIAFDTNASNLVPGDTNGTPDVVRVANPLAVQDTLVGGPGNDTYLVNALDTIVEAPNEGSDTVRTLLSAYTLPDNVEVLQYTGSGAFTGTGNALANTLSGGPGNDTLNGSAGTDTVSYAFATAGVTVGLAAGGAQNTVGAGIDTLANFENLTGSAFNDFLQGSAGNNVINGGGGTDTVSYANAAAAVAVNLGLTTAQNTGGAGTDTILNIENLTGSGFNDTLQGNAANNVLNGDAGIDTASYAGASAGVTVSLAIAGAQNTVGAGSDTLTGFENLAGSAFNDTLTGNALNNILVGNAGNDTLTGGAGIDTASYSSAPSAVTVSLAIAGAQNTAGAGNDTLAGFENLAGSAFNDTLTGDGLNNTLNGNAGNDTLVGGGGNDVLLGAAGSDTLTGNAGADSFHFNSLVGVDTVTDFISGTDKFRFSQAAIRIGDGDTVIDASQTVAGPGGFAAANELVIVTGNVAGAISTATAAAAIGSASAAYAVGRTALFAVDNGSASGLFLFTSSGADAVVSAAELTLIATASTAASTVLADYVFAA